MWAATRVGRRDAAAAKYLGSPPTQGGLPRSGSLLRWLGSTNHKDIGTSYLVLAVVAGVVGGALSMLLRAELLHPGAMSSDPTLNVPSLSVIAARHGLIMILFAVMPALLGGFGNWLIPMMIGAPDTAFPRLNRAALWMAVAGFLMTVGGLLFGMEWAMDLTLISLLLFGFSSLLLAINFIVTIFNMRAPGLTLHDMPLFVWSQLVTAFLLVLAIPVLAGAVTLLISDRDFGTGFAGPQGAGDTMLLQRLAWFFGHPELYILVLPGFGIISQVISTFSGRRMVGHLAMVYAMVAIGVVGFMAWAHHMFVAAMPVDGRISFMVAALVIAVPTAVAVSCWIATMRGVRIALKAPMLWSAGFIVLFGIGGASGVVLADASLARHLSDTDIVVAHFHYVLSLSAVFAIFAGFYFWIGKMTGRAYPERLGQVHFWTFFIGVNLSFLPELFPGAGAGRTTVSAIGGFIAGASTLLFLLVVLVTLSRRPTLAANYWGSGATSLEWSVPSPAPRRSFDELARFT